MHKMPGPPKWYVAWSVAAVFITLSSGCTPSPKAPNKYFRDGKSYGVTDGLFNQRWWSYAERGISFAEGEFWTEAMADFEAAIVQRDKDQRRARTYGMHFVDYFPHRELGIVYYRTGQYDLAIQELERSLADEESAKAKFYLNKVRQALVGKKSLDRSPPEISITSPPPSLLVTNESQLSLAGFARDDNYVATIKVNGTPLFIELSEKELPFSHHVSLSPGANRITIQAVDINGRDSTVERTVNLDLAGPLVSIAEIVPTPDGSLTVTGAVEDESAVVSLQINGLKYPVPAGAKEVLFREFLLTSRFHFAAKDAAGNLSEETIDLRPHTLPATSTPQKPIILAANSLSGIKLQPTSLSADNSPSPPGPTIQLKGGEQEATFQDKILIEGMATGDNAINKISLNNVPMLFRPGKRVFFNHLAVLREGENQFTINATDSNGLTSSTVTTVNRKVSKVHSIGSRMSLAVLSFAKVAEASEMGDLTSELFQAELSTANRFQLVIRKDLDSVLKELKLSQTELVDPSSAVKIGKLTAAETVVVGTVVQKGESVEVTANHVKTETAKILSSQDVYAESSDIPTLKYLMAGLALKLQKHFPLIEGMIIKVKDDAFYLDLGKQSGMTEDMEVIAYREGEPIKHPVSGKLLGSDPEETGILTVTSVQDEFALAKVRKAGKVPIRNLDRIITR